MKTIQNKRLIACLVLLLFASSRVSADTIVLRSLVRVAPGAPVRLADVTELSGSDAQSLSGLVVVAAAPGAGESTTVSLATVREIVEKQAQRCMGRLTLSGTSCIVRGIQAEQPAAAAPARVVEAAPIAQGETVRDRVAARIASSLAADPLDLKLVFEDQADLLAMATQGRTIAVQPAAMGDKIPMTIRVYEGDRILAQGTARVNVLVRREVMIARTSISRGGTIAADGVDADRQWLSPTATPATHDQAVGGVVRGHVDAGKIIMQRDVEPPIVVKRGDLITVDCIAGTVVVGTTARAKEQGREGQVIELQSLSSKKTFSARVSGPGRAVMLAPGDESKGVEP